MVKDDFKLCEHGEIKIKCPICKYIKPKKKMFDEVEED
jgi:hypothetical protein